MFFCCFGGERRVCFLGGFSLGVRSGFAIFLQPPRPGGPTSSSCILHFVDVASSGLEGRNGDKSSNIIGAHKRRTSHLKNPQSSSAQIR